MDPGNDSDDFERNPDSCQRIKLLKTTSHETDQVIPELILAAQVRRDEKRREEKS